MKISKLLRFLFSRMVIVGIILAIQVIWFVAILVEFSNYSIYITTGCTILSGIAVLWIINKPDNPAYKIAWIIPILALPILGGLLYLAFGTKKPSKRMRENLARTIGETKHLLEQDKEVFNDLKKEDEGAAGQANYIDKFAGYPIHKNTTAEYHKIGEQSYKVLLEELKKAEHFIFMEYFIIEEGIMWNSILEVLESKAKAGVDVRLMYDDVGCINLLPYGYDKQLEEKGIKCIAFNPFVPVFSVAMNNRDHRKITVIDGHTAFSGGINLADEYINEKVRFGHWKDTGIMVKGEGVWNFTLMFLQMWNAYRKTDSDYEVFKPHVNKKDEFVSDGFVQPYGDSPLDGEGVGESVYMNILNNAKRYVYIFTPYLIIDNEMNMALCLAAKRGVDVRIVTPGIPDKKMVFRLTQSYYKQLIKAGVKIYEYTPGFIHAKSFVCDDKFATVGTINMDYRSLYLHFECGVFMYNNSAIKDIKEDSLETIGKSKEITIEDCNRGLFIRIGQVILRVFAPLM